MSSKKTNKRNGSIEIIGSGKYPLVPLSCIDIVERPSEGDESSRIFFNPRSITSFTADKMAQLQHSIRADGLQQPPIARAITSDGTTVVQLELIAGERRIRACKSIVDENLPCFDENAPQPESYSEGDTIICKGRFGTVVEHNEEIVIVDFEDDHIGEAEQKECSFDDCLPTISGSELYENIPCKLVYDCSDERALRLAFTENDQSDPLTIAEEVALVERLEKSGLKLEEIAELLGSNVTWVSQTSNFREQLPKNAFQKLLKGEMTRHVAVSILSYSPDVRQSLYAASVAAEAEETAEKIKLHKQEKDRHEDDEDLLLAEAKSAAQAGDVKAESRAKRKAAAAATKAEKASEKLERAKHEKGTIKQGHVKKGALNAGVQPKKAKVLDRDDIESIFVEGILPFIDEEQTDELTGEMIPVEYAGIVRRTALAIIAGIRDPLHPIREYCYDMEMWSRAESTDSTDDDSSSSDDEDDEDSDETVDNDDANLEGEESDDEFEDNTMDDDEFQRRFGDV